MEDTLLEKYRPFNREEHTTDNPEAVMKAIKEMYPESQGFHVEFKIVDSIGPIRERGSKTVITDIYIEKNIKKTF